MAGSSPPTTRPPSSSQRARQDKQAPGPQEQTTLLLLTATLSEHRHDSCRPPAGTASPSLTPALGPEGEEASGGCWGRVPKAPQHPAHRESVQRPARVAGAALPPHPWASPDRTPPGGQIPHSAGIS